MSERNASGQRGSGGDRNRRPLTPEQKRRRAAQIRAKKKKRRRRMIALLVSAVIIIALIVCGIVLAVNAGKNRRSADGNAKETETVSEEFSEEITTEAPRYEVDLVAVGDVLMHTPLINYADQGDGTYDFNSIFAETKDVISAADIAVCNQETPVDPTQPADGGIQFIFNTPEAIADAEINAGFDIVLQSSNHSYDMGADGILNTIDMWKSKADKAMMIGLNSSAEERDEIKIYEKNNIRFAVLNYTYGLNGFVLPEDMPYLTTVIDDEHREMIIDDIKRADEMADFVIVFPHWGVEDLVGDITEFQDEWGKVFTAAGADLIIGAHPHVTEKIEWIESEGNRSLCYYSVGNYASNQQELPEVLCGMAKVKIVKDGDKTYIEENGTGVIPLVTHNEMVGDFTNRVVVYKLSDYTEDLAALHDIRNRFDGSFSKENLDALATDVFGDWILE